MNIWLIHPCNQLPGDAWRESRIQSIASALVARGHECLWWTANFSHHTKSFRSKGWKDIDVQPCYRIRLVPTPAYYRHVGLARLRFHWLLSWRIYRRGRTERRPDAIIVNDAPLGDSWWAWCLARRFRAKLILDITDEWPEQFVLAFAPSWRRIVQPIFSPLYVIRETKGNIDSLTLKQIESVSRGRCYTENLLPSGSLLEPLHFHSNGIPK